MPLIKGKSPKSFNKNVETEMESGKPQKQALAIAYAVKRKSKKMAKGDMVPKEDMSRDMDESVFSEGAEGNHDLHPGNAASRALSEIADEHLCHEAQDHEVIAEPAEPKRHIVPKMAAGGMVKRIMAKRMAQGGQLPEDMDYLAEEDSYPDPDYKELDMLDPDEMEMMAEGGEVKPSPSPSPSSAKEDFAKKLKEGMKGVFYNGGMIKSRIKKIMSK